MRFTAFLIMVLSFNSTLLAQGNLLLVGGGAEKQGGWSDEPYRWAIEKAPNKKVAIISTDAGSDPNWLIDYFKSLGAVEAKNFEFPNRESAEVAGLFDLLNSYDVLFFKGGNQWLYHQFFKDTDIEKAMLEVFARGGVLGGTSAGMAILGEFDYSAEKSSILPWEGLIDIYNENFTITSDFAPMLKGFITDTHFLERGRMPRLASFLAHYQLLNGVNIKGIACDDQTALAIDASNKATTFGNGGAYIYELLNASETGNQWSGTISGKHLSYGMSIDLNTLEIVKGPEAESQGYRAENGNYEVYLVGSNIIDRDADLVKELAGLEGDMLIVTGSSRLTAANLLQALADNGKNDVSIMSAIPDNNNSESCELRNKVRSARYVAFIANDFEALQKFLTDGPTGELLNAHIRRDLVSTVFFGEDCKLSGATYATNNLEDPALAYQGNLSYTTGLGLLQNSIINPGAFDPDSEIYYENNTLSGLFALGAEQLSNTIYINKESWGRFYAKDNQNLLEAYGKYSMVVVQNRSTSFQLFDQNTGSKPRNNASYDSLVLQMLGHGTNIVIGEPIPSNSPEYEFEIDPDPAVVTGLMDLDSNPLIYPNISNDYFNLSIDRSGKLMIYSLSGVQVFSQSYSSGEHRFDLDKPGMYLVCFMDGNEGKLLKFQKIIRN